MRFYIFGLDAQMLNIVKKVFKEKRFISFVPMMVMMSIIVLLLLLTKIL